MKARLQVDRTYNASRGRETEEDSVRREYYGSKVFWTPVNCLEVDLFSSASREHRPIFEPDKETAEREDEAEHPEHQGRSH